MTKSPWIRNDRDHWRCRLLGCVLDVAELETDKWGWTVCLGDHLIEAGMTTSIENAKIAAVEIYQSSIASQVVA